MNGGKEARVADAVLAGLKDFQRRTVDWVFERLYEKEGGSGRFLVADEVGLGKTLVARGVIARAIDHLRATVPRIDVLYICSNGDIARQNIQRLKLDGDGHVALASRLTMLPLEVGKLKSTSTGVNFISFTPATSFDVRDGLGQAQERVLLYWMLRKAWDLGAGKAMINVFRGHVGADRFRERIDSFDRSLIDVAAQEAFEKALSKRVAQEREGGAVDLRAQLDALCQAFSSSSRTIDQETGRARGRFVGALRSVLAESCVEALEPDIVILDEFQRFSHLLDDDEDEASVLARAVFEYPKVRVLLLSATPYKMYTLSDEEGEDDHYRDFVRTIRFLEGKTGGTRLIEDEMEAYQSAVLGLTQADGPERLRRATGRLTERLRRVMVRTERLASTPDRNGMLVEVPGAPLELRSSDVLDYLAVQAVSRVVGQQDAIEYWKSAPYVLSFLDEGYKLKTELRKALDAGDQRMPVARALSLSPTATLPWDKVHGYKEVEPGNPRMRALVDELLGTGAHRLLWIPPAMPYYALGGPFADAGVARLTKRLVFSSWRVVPRAIAAMLSYEVERRVFSEDPGAEYTPEYRAGRRGSLRFGAEADGRLTGMAVLALLYPSLYLAEACDPAKLSVELARDRSCGDAPCSLGAIPATDILQLAKERIQFAVDKHLPRTRADGPADERWYWAAPLLLDRKLREATTVAWFQQEDLAAAWSGAADADEPVEGEERAGRGRWAEHVEEARTVALGGVAAATSAEGQKALGRMPDDLVDVLAHLAIGGPAVTMFRAMLHVVGGESALDEAGRTALRNGAGTTAWAFRARFNQPEVVALLRGMRRDDDTTPYWRQVLDYCVNGCLQAVLDEYVHVLRDHLGLLAGTIGERVHEVADEIVQAIELRTSRVAIDDLVRSEAGRTVKRVSRNLRTHFALRYGDERSDDGSLVTRADHVRKAFNSPFWPFVLTTTSVGQEGLDFHTYCHSVLHWNVPSNPVDFEQREGRVHRYKGHAVRKNIAEAHGEAAIHDGDRDRWEAMFARALERRSADATHIVPYWIFLDGAARIERHVPALPLSHDRERIQRLRSSLAVYRMVFGQPRQEDLVAYLIERVPRSELDTLMAELRIDLSPDRSASA
ncbi:helicase-related protein [Sorangium sp. So ce381]|uniref:helicase-related protein n=1 Tax=Sorangium sp. So ce381 TaxID=3133307 RepID=UPI003F5C8C97